MSGMRLKVKRVRYILLFHVVVLSLWPCMWCVDEDEYSQTGNDALLPNVTEQVFKKLKNITTILIRDIEENLEFCIKDECVIFCVSGLLGFFFFRPLFYLNP